MKYSTIIRSVCSLVVASAILFPSHEMIQAKPGGVVLLPATSCSASSLFGGGCSADCGAGSSATCKGGVFSSSCGCVAQARFNRDEVKAEDVDKGRSLPEYLDAYGTAEAAELAQHVRTVIAAYEAGSPDEYSDAEVAFSDAYEAASHTLKHDIAEAIGNDGLIPWREPIGTDRTCDAEVTADISGAVDRIIDLSGAATFHYAAISDAGADIAWADLSIVDLRHDDGGDVVLEVDHSRAITSRIEALNPGESFPAKSTLRFYAIITIEELDKKYRSLNEIVIENPDLEDWPHSNTVYTQVGETEFEDLDEPGEVALTLSGASVTVTAQ